MCEIGGCESCAGGGGDGDACEGEALPTDCWTECVGPERTKHWCGVGVGVGCGDWTGWGEITTG